MWGVCRQVGRILHRSFFTYQAAIWFFLPGVCEQIFLRLTRQQTSRLVVPGRLRWAGVHWLWIFVVSVQRDFYTGHLLCDMAY